MPGEIADDLGGIGDIAFQADAMLDGAAWRLPRWTARGRFGEAEGSATARDDALQVTAAIRGADALNLVRPVAALAALTERSIALNVTGERLVLGDSAPGRAALRANREKGLWRLESLEAEGFDGATLRATRDGEAHRFTLEARRAEAVSALAERLTPSGRIATALRALRGVSPVALQGRLARGGPGYELQFDGRAGELAASGPPCSMANGAGPRRT